MVNTFEKYKFKSSELISKFIAAKLLNSLDYLCKITKKSYAQWYLLSKILKIGGDFLAKHLIFTQWEIDYF